MLEHYFIGDSLKTLLSHKYEVMKCTGTKVYENVCIRQNIVNLLM
jgi:hypothetical protein